MIVEIEYFKGDTVLEIPFVTLEDFEKQVKEIEEECFLKNFLLTLF